MDTRFILVVEDDPILKNLLGHTFAGRYQTLYAADGEQALQLFEANKPACVLLDLMLPKLDGFGVLQAIRARADALKSVPVVIISNLGADKDKERALQLGATDYMVKADVAVEEIVAKIEQVLAAQPAAAPAAPASGAPAAPPALSRPAR